MVLSWSEHPHVSMQAYNSVQASEQAPELCAVWAYEPSTVPVNGEVPVQCPVHGPVPVMNPVQCPVMAPAAIQDSYYACPSSSV